MNYSAHAVAYSLWLLLVAPFLASFAMLVVDRLPVMFEAEAAGVASPVTLTHPPSRCSTCHHALAWYELIPILSWCVQKGRCRACGALIPAPLLAFEAIAPLFAAYALWLAGPTLLAFGWLVFYIALVAVAVIDYRHLIAPDEITLPVLWMSLLLCAFHAGAQPLPDAILGAVVGYLLLWVPQYLYQLRNPGQIGIGLGDAKLFAMIGAWMGPAVMVHVLLAGCLIGLVFGFWHRRQFSDDSVHIPFAPALSLGAIIIQVCYAR